MKYTLITLLAIFITSATIAQPPTIQWAKCYGGSANDGAACVRQTTDGGYIIVGNSVSSDSEVSTHHGATFLNDIWVVKADNAGAISWAKVYGGSGSDNAQCIQQTTDGGYILAGGTTSTDGDISGLHAGGGGDMLVLKLDASGSISWQKCLGGSGDEYAFSIQQTKDGGYVVAGYTSSNDGDVSGTHKDSSGALSQDVWVVKLNNSGGISWQKPLGGTGTELANSVQQTADSGYIVAGYTNSDDGDITKRYSSSQFYDGWLIKLNTSGTLSWQESLGGTGYDALSSVKQTTDGGYIVTGSTSSNDNDVSGNHVDSNGNPTEDVWVLKMDNTGAINWQRCYGGTGTDLGTDVYQTADGGYVVAGVAASRDGDVTYIHPSTASYVPDDFWVLQLLSSGDISWQKCLGGSRIDYACSIQQTNDGGYIVAGSTQSTNYDVTNNHGQFDFWTVKLAKPATVNEINAVSHLINISPNPSHNSFTLQYHLSTDANIVVTDVVGRAVDELTISKNTRQATINAANWQPGTYFYKILQKGNVLENGKLVKE